MKTIETSFCGIKLQGPIFNASGPRNVTLKELEILAKNPGVSAILLKSCTLEPRIGNQKPRWAETPHGGINSAGLPNLGYQAYVDMIPHLRTYEKPIIASISGFSLAGNLTMIEAFKAAGADAIEINVACPNIKGKPMVGYDLEQMQALMAAIKPYKDIPLGIKLPPYLDTLLLKSIAECIRGSNLKFISGINTIANNLVIDPETLAPAIKAGSGIGGGSGPMIKALGLGNIRLLSQALQDTNIEIIGIGGIQSGQDVLDYILCGASCCQIGTTFLKEGPDCFARINAELFDLLKKHGYPNIRAARGQLRENKTVAKDSDL